MLIGRRPIKASPIRNWNGNNEISWNSYLQLCQCKSEGGTACTETAGFIEMGHSDFTVRVLPGQTALM